MNSFDDLMNFDAVAAAQRVTGRTLDDPYTVVLAAHYAKAAEQVKSFELYIRGDTFSGMRFDDAIDVFGAMGFEAFHLEDIDSTDIWTLLWHPDGILLDAESYTPAESTSSLLNHARAFFNLRLDSVLDSIPELVSTGFTVDDSPLFSGCADFTEGAKHKMGKLAALGSFQSEWSELPWLLAPHSRSYSGDTDMSIDQTLWFDRQRLSVILQSFPASVRTMIESAADRRLTAFEF